jgi:hypothetical protein
MPGRFDNMYVTAVDAIEVSPLDGDPYVEGGDSVLCGIICQGSGIDFSTLRLVLAGVCMMLVLFSRHEARKWFVSPGIDETDETTINRLDKIEKLRVVESIDLTQLSYR